MRRWPRPFFTSSQPPPLDEMQEHFDNYDDIINMVTMTGQVIQLDAVADSSDDSIEAFHRRHPFYWDDRAVIEARRAEYERRQIEEWRRVLRARADALLALEQRRERAALIAALHPVKQRRQRLRTYAAALLPEPSPARRPAINPFAEVRRRKELIPVLENTRRIREELNRRHAEGPEEYLFPNARRNQ